MKHKFHSKYLFHIFISNYIYKLHVVFDIDELYGNLCFTDRLLTTELSI